jgi:SpoVK/Ycf46/Vps4 family AAA+-type ATPase
MPKVDELARLIRKEIDSGSIYKGKAVRFDMPKLKDESQREHMSVEDFCPSFMPLDPGLTKSTLVLPRLVQASVEELVFSPVERTKAFREHSIPLRNGIILFGPPGCGKTLIAAILANMCVQHNWTYVEVTDVGQLADAYRFAADRGPAVLQLEDIDRLMDDDPNVIPIIRNTLDGVDTKGAEVQVVFTTNHAHRLPDSLIRSGRLGGHIMIPPPDSEAAQRLLRNYAGKYLPAAESLAAAGKTLAGRVPAMLADVTARAKRRAIIRGDWDNGGPTEITGADVHLTAELVTGEFDSLQPIPEDNREPLERGLDHIADAVKVLGETVEPDPFVLDLEDEGDELLPQSEPAEDDR